MVPMVSGLLQKKVERQFEVRIRTVESTLKSKSPVSLDREFIYQIPVTSGFASLRQRGLHIKFDPRRERFSACWESLENRRTDHFIYQSKDPGLWIVRRVVVKAENVETHLGASGPNLL
jgi:hypothetical protein